MNRQIRLLLFFIGVMLSTLQAKPETTRTELYYGIAEGNYLIGNLEGAKMGIEQMLQLEPEYVPALTLNARILVDMSKPDKALQSVEHAIALEPENHEHQLLKALVLGNLNRRNDAIESVEKVLQNAPVESKDHHVASKLLGLLLMAESKWDAAAAILNQSYLNNPETLDNLELANEAYLQKANYAIAQNDFDTAVEAIDQALKTHRHLNGKSNLIQRSQLRMLRAQTLTRAGQIDEAIKDLRHITSQQPDNLAALTTLALLYASTARWQSLEDILGPISANPELQDIALYLKGHAALANNRFGTARELFESALRILPDGPGKLRASLEFYQGVCFLKVDRIQEGNSKILLALENGFQPETEEEAMIAGRILIQTGRAERAIQLLEAITLQRVTDSPEAWNLLGRAHLARHSTALALSALNQSLKIDPNQSETLALRGSLLRKMGNLTAATTDIQQALELDPKNPAFTYSLGLIYLQTGNLDAAETQLGLSARTLANNPGIHLLHALLAYNTQTYDQAKAALDTYFTLVPEKTNESAFYLEYAQTALENTEAAIDTLQQQIESSDATPMLKNFLAYTRGELDRKAILDAAGHAPTPESARQRICEIAYWLAQHERAQRRHQEASELLELAIQVGSPDNPEYQFAKWQLNLAPSF